MTCFLAVIVWVDVSVIIIKMQGFLGTDWPDPGPDVNDACLSGQVAQRRRGAAGGTQVQGAKKTLL
jgi:hypothetical protein